MTPASTTIAAPVAASAVRVVIESRATAPIDGSASPRKPSVADARQVAVGELRGGVALDRELEVLGGHAGAVVDDADEPAAAALDRHLDRAGAGIDRVLDQFLHRRRRALDHFARRDAVDEDGIEAADGHQRLRIVIPGLAEGENPDPMTANAPDDDARKTRR